MNNNIAIDQNVPIPTKVRNKRRGRKMKYHWPIDKMQVSESIYVPNTELPQRVQNGEDYGTHYTISIVRSHMRHYKLKGRKFVHRNVIDEVTNKPIGVRIWRTK